MTAGICRMFCKSFWRGGLENNHICKNTNFYIYGNDFGFEPLAAMNRTGFAV
jgi:hypothetical protein